MPRVVHYLARLSSAKVILWCYLLWYLYFAWRYFDPTRSLWLTSLGLSGIIGFALVLSTAGGNTRLERWQLFRLFLMPFCVSSFAALVKGRGFLLVFSPRWEENAIAVGLCAAFCALVWILRRATR